MKCGLPDWPSYSGQCPGIRIHDTTGEACVGVMQVGRQTEEEIRRRIENAGKRWRHQAVAQHKLELAKAIGSIATTIPRLEEVMDTAVLEVLRWPSSVQEQARIGSMGLRGSQEYRWVTIGPGAHQEMEEWLQHLDATPPNRTCPCTQELDIDYHTDPILCAK
jgi:hypothetical protein